MKQNKWTSWKVMFEESPVLAKVLLWVAMMVMYGWGLYVGSKIGELRAAQELLDDDFPESINSDEK